MTFRFEMKSESNGFQYFFVMLIAAAGLFGICSRAKATVEPACWSLKVTGTEDFIPQQVCVKSLSFSPYGYTGDDEDLLEIDSDLFKGTLQFNWLKSGDQHTVGEVQIDKVIRAPGDCESMEHLVFLVNVQIDMTSGEVLKMNSLTLKHAHWADLCHTKQPLRMEYNYIKN